MTDAANGDTLLVWQIERLWNGRVVLSGRCTSTMAYNMAIDVVRDFNGREARNYSAPHLADWVDAKPGHRFNLGCGSEEVGYGGMRAVRLPDHDSAPEGNPQIVTPTTDMAPARAEPVKGYDIIDRQSGRVVGHAKTLRAALRSVDRRDNAYGGYRYFHRATR